MANLILARMTCSTNSGAKFLKGPSPPPSDPPSYIKCLLERAEDFCPLTKAFANDFVAVIGESQIIKIQWIYVGLQINAYTMRASMYVIYITSYESRKIFRPAMLKGP